MGSFDCYCILCAVTMNIGVLRLGSRKGKALRKRKRVVDRAKRRCTGEKVSSDDVESEDENEEMEDAIDHEALEKQRIEQQEQEEDDADSDYEYSEESSSEDTQSVDSSDFDLLRGSSEILDVATRPRTPEPEPEPVEEVDYDNWSQAPELDLKGRWNTHPSVDINDFEDDSFDPRLVQLDDCRWINRVRALARNDERKVYITGRGRYYDYGFLDVMGTGRDPNDPGETSLNITSYNEEVEDSQALPFHEACFDILAKSIGLEKGREIDKEVMWEVIRAHLVAATPVLDVDYNVSAPHEQFWCNMPGAEYEVCDPSPRPDLQENIQDILPANIFGRTAEFGDLTQNTCSDPVTVLPYDILLEFIGYMDTKDMLSLMKASYHVNSSTRGAAFWKYMTHLRILPWFYELRYFVETTSTDAIDYKGLFLWADALTRPQFGNQGPLMHVANRRRIWGCCQPLASLYAQKTGSVKPAEREDSEEAKAILDSSVCLQMPMTMYPPPEEVETVSAQFIHAWNEINHRSCVLDTYWRQVEQNLTHLVGISVTLGGQTRLFGSSKGRTGRPLHIDHGEWIKQIICTVNPIYMFRENRDKPDRRPEDVKPSRTAGICGMQVLLTTGKEKLLKHHHRSGTKRQILVLDGMFLTGLTGQIASNGAISRLGLLQASRLDSAPVAQAQFTTAQKMAWTSGMSWLPCDTNDRERAPIWSHPFIRCDLFPASTYPSPYDPHEDVMPNEIFMWNKGGTVIECFQPIATSIARLPSQTPAVEHTEQSKPAHVSNDIPSIPGSSTRTDSSSSYQFQTGLNIIGIRASPPNPFGSGPSVGQQGPLMCQHPKWAHGMTSWPLRELIRIAWKDLYKQDVPRPGRIDNPNTVTFPLNGESITEVHVEQQYRAFKLVTQTGRVGYFGEPDMRDWFVRKAAGGERFVGITTCFGGLSGWSESAKMWGHWKLSRVGVLFERTDGDGEVVDREKEKKMREMGVVFEEGRVVTSSDEDGD